jgi:2-keto-4-pentenoate hydratase/2-oxohepta-3-ene-1,7-dioic acid hydratase in catechol pathway
MKILCVGRNYARHVREMGVPPAREPVWFWKPETSIVGDGDAIELPAGIGEVHHEVELAVRLGRQARRITARDALRHLDGVTVALDVTARDLQAAAKEAGTPWAQAKGFDTFCPLGAWQPLGRDHDHNGDRDLQDLHLRLAVDGQVRQQAPTSEMTWTVADLVARASQWTTLRPGDVLLTGTPEGVGPLRAGETVTSELVGLVRLRNRVVAAPP